MIRISVYSVNADKMYQGFLNVISLPLPNQTIMLGNKKYLVKYARLTAKKYGYCYVY